MPICVNTDEFCIVTYIIVMLSKSTKKFLDKYNNHGKRTKIQTLETLAKLLRKYGKNCIKVTIVIKLP